MIGIEIFDSIIIKKYSLGLLKGYAVLPLIGFVFSYILGKGDGIHIYIVNTM
jgi:hypothetical protein